MEIRRATSSDLLPIQEFIADTYGATATFKGSERWHWQFINTPFRPTADHGPTVWIAESDKSVAGQIAVQDAFLWLEGQRVNASWIVDVMVHPDFRGRGLGHRIHDLVAVDRTTLVTLTMAPATRRMAERANCITLGETRQYILPIQISGHTVARYAAYKTSRRKWLGPIAKAFNKSQVGPSLLGKAIGSAVRVASFLRKRVCLEDFEVDEVATFPAEIDEFWETTRDAYPAVFERGERFLNWRFCDCPGLDYRRFILRRGGKIRGYLVTRIGDSTELPLGVVVDFFAHPNDEAALDALLSLARNELAPHCEYLEAAASTESYRQALERAGFIATRRFRPTVVTSDAKVRAFAKKHGQDWHFTKADHDWDQVHPM